MQTFRRGMPVVIIVLIIMFVGLFVYQWGYERTGQGRTGPQNNSAVASVNGEEISIAEFEAEVKLAVKQQRQGNPNAPVDEEQIRDQVYQQLVNQTLIRQTAKRLGITVSDEELQQAMLYDPPPQLKSSFSDSTGFREQDYQAFITDVQGYLAKVNAQRPADQKIPPEQVQETIDQVVRIERNVRLQRMIEGVQDVVAASAVPSPAEARAAYNEEHTKASGSFVMIDGSAYPDSSIKVTDEEARAYYDQHKNDFQQKASREARYIIFPLGPSAKDSADVNRRLKQVTDAVNRATTPEEKAKVFQNGTNAKYNGATYTPLQEVSPEMLGLLTGSHPGDVIGPVHLSDGNYMINFIDVKDTGDLYVKASHILFKIEDSTATKANDSIKAVAEKVLRQAQAGEDFGKLALTYSGDQGTAQKGGDLGYFKKEGMVPEFGKAAFEAQPGTIVGLVKTQFGYHIIKVIDRTNKSYRLRDMKFDPKVSPLTKTQLRARAKQVRDKVAAGANIDTVANEMKLQAVSTGAVDHTAATAGSTRFTNFIVTGKAGDVSEIYELKDGSVLVGQITKIRTAGAKDFADAKEEIIAKLRGRKKLDMVKARAEKILSSLAPGDSLGKITAMDSTLQVHPFNDAASNTPFPGVGFDYPLTAAIFKLKPGERSGLIRGERGYYIASVSKRTDPTDKDYAAEKAKALQQIVQQRRQQVFQEWLDKERERAEIIDYRNGR